MTRPSLLPSRRRAFRASLVAGAACLAIACLAAPSAWADDPKLLGACSETDLRAEPYAEWFESGYDGYEPHAEVLAELKTLLAEADGIDITVFFGTWCGDSRRQVPRFLRLLKDAGFPADKIDIVAVDNDDALHKRSPDGEEVGKHIFRVPTLIVSRGGDEIGRIVEHPVRSLERDLRGILKGDGPAPAYRSYPLIIDWYENGLLSDSNVDPSGLAMDLRALGITESELWSVSRVLRSRGEADEALKVQQVSCDLHRTSLCSSRLALALFQAGSMEDALEEAENGLGRLQEPAVDTAEHAGILLEIVKEAQAAISSPEP